jgi:oxygen-independent coproporphyrinogen-3 oxidase
MPLGIYIHIPFCKTKCNYCNFYSIEDTSYIAPFVTALLKEFEIKTQLYSNLVEHHETVTIFVGGGTPTLINKKNLEIILQKILHIINKPIIEFTFEANPESIDEEKLKLLKDYGVNRLSLGIQSFDNDTLKLLGRPHTLETALKKYGIAKKYFNNISIDLIAGIPGHPIEYKKYESYIKKLQPQHISCYLLSKDKKTSWVKNIQIDDEEQAKDYNTICKILKSLKYCHYEVSNFCKKGKECKHNINYWYRGEYLGFGPSAVTFIKNTNGNYLRIQNVRDLKSYIVDPLKCKKEKIDPIKTFWETIFLKLRLKEGLHEEELIEFKDIINLASFIKTLDFLCEKHLIKKTKKGYYIPEKYFLIMNEIVLWLMKQSNA